jgi:5-methylcytosine-specific restriction endonuclease McrA
MAANLKGLLCMSLVFVLDANEQPLAPCPPRRARLLLKARKAAVYRRFPFVIILKRAITRPKLPALRLKIAPGQKATGLAIVNQECVVFAAEVTHRSERIHRSLGARRLLRRNRRQRKTRYRQPRFSNRSRAKGWLAPSLQSRVSNVVTFVKRLLRFCSIRLLSLEMATYDMQKMQRNETTGNEYQPGTLHTYEVKQHLLEKFHRKCVYCKKTGVPLQVEHVVPLARGGTNRLSNKTLACQPCNQKKANKTAEEFGFPRVQKQAKTPLKTVAAINSTRLALHRQLLIFGLPVETGTTGRTKYNRHRLGLPKAPWTDAAAVGASTPAALSVSGGSILRLRAMGHGSRKMRLTDKPGTGSHRQRMKTYHGFQTGDYVQALFPKGKHTGKHCGRVTVTARGDFRLWIDGKEASLNHKHCTRLFRADGYSYAYGASA